MIEVNSNTNPDTHDQEHTHFESTIDPNDAGAQEMLMAAHGLSINPVTLSATMAPISPYGVGEMIRASKIEVSALDDYLYQSEINGPLKCNLSKPSGAKVLAAKRYQSHSADTANEEIKTSSPKVKQAIQTIQNISAINQSILDAFELPENELPVYQTINERTTSREEPDISCNQMLNRKKDLQPYAAKYIKQMGYSLDSQEAEQLLKETVDFYSTSPALAETLRNLVQTLESS